jgi:23S rRNA maturation mini-RNase III
MNENIEGSTYENYLTDMSHELIERARMAKTNWEAASKDNNAEKKSIAWGELLALYGVLTLMKQQAEGFAVPSNRIGLAEFDPDRELL